VKEVMIPDNRKIFQSNQRLDYIPVRGTEKIRPFGRFFYVLYLGKK